MDLEADVGGIGAGTVATRVGEDEMGRAGVAWPDVGAVIQAGAVGVLNEWGGGGCGSWGAGWRSWGRSAGGCGSWGRSAGRWNEGIDVKGAIVVWIDNGVGGANREAAIIPFE